MRLIDELLKDDFFRGGYQPDAQPSKAADTSGGPNKLIFVAAGVILLAALAAGGYFFLAPKSTAPVQTAALPPSIPVPRPTAQPATAPTVAAADVTEAADTEALTEIAAGDSAPAPEAVVAEEAAAAAPKAQPAPVAKKTTPPPAPPARTTPKVENFSLNVAAMTDKAEADRIVARLRAQQLKASIKPSQAKSTVFAIQSPAPVAPAEFNAVKLKASLFKLPLKESTVAEGIRYDLGSYGTRVDAEKVLAIAERAGIAAAISEKTATVPAFAIEAAGFTDRSRAEQTASALSKEGIKATVKKVP